MPRTAISTLATLVLGCSFVGVVSTEQAQPPAAAPGQAIKSQCPVADDENYGYTIEMPVQIGGGAMYVAARERRYLDALRGPAGQPIQYKRLGSAHGPATDEKTPAILDEYEVTYEGADKPMHLFLDVYHYWPQRAPKGFICGHPIALAPMMDQFKASDDLASTALEQGAARSFAPIPLGAGGATTHGVAFDTFRLIALASSAATATGKPLPGKPRPASGMVIVAYTLTCDGRSVAPTGIDILDPQGALVRRTGDYAKGDALAALLPGVMPPEGSLAALFVIPQPRQNDRIRITYAEAACPGEATHVLLPVRVSAARPASFPPPLLPESATPQDNRVLLQVFIDLDGALQRATYVGGPPHLRQAAIDAVKAWRAEPGRINGAPIGTSTLLEVRFTPRP